MDKLYTYNSNNYSNIENSNFHYYRFHFDLLKPAAAPKSLQSCPTPQMAAHQAPPSLGFSRQEYWSGLPCPSPVHESESEAAQLCLTLSNPVDCSPPGSSAHGIFQAGVLEWGAIAFILLGQEQML